MASGQLEVWYELGGLDFRSSEFFSADNSFSHIVSMPVLTGQFDGVGRPPNNTAIENLVGDNTFAVGQLVSARWPDEGFGAGSVALAEVEAVLDPTKILIKPFTGIGDELPSANLGDTCFVSPLYVQNLLPIFGDKFRLMAFKVTKPGRVQVWRDDRELIERDLESNDGWHWADGWGQFKAFDPPSGDTPIALDSVRAVSRDVEDMFLFFGLAYNN